MKKSRSLQRQELIMQMLTSQPSVSIDELMERLKVSEWTLRRDMTELEDRRLIVRHYGGASIAQTGQNQYVENMENFQRSMNRNVGAKWCIGRRTAALLHEDQHIALGAGTTTTEVARGLMELNKRQWIVTNALNIALELSTYPHLHMTCTGGDAHGDYYTLTGPVAERAIRAHYFDVAIIGASGVSSQGFTVNSQLNAAILLTMIEQSQRLIIVADSAKFNCARFAQLAPLETADVLVTDACPPDSLRDQLEAAGVTIIVSDGQTVG